MRKREKDEWISSTHIQKKRNELLQNQTSSSMEGYGETKQVYNVKKKMLIVGRTEKLRNDTFRIH